MTVIESWLIPVDIILIVCTTLSIILAIIFLFIIILDRACHTVPMMLIANSCLAGLVTGCSTLGTGIYTLENDLKQIQYQDLLCIFRAYMIATSGALLFYSFLLQAIYRYVTVIYPNRLSWRSARYQALLICLTWIFAFVFPTAFMFTNEIVYNVDNQICLLPLRLSFSLIYTVLCIYIIPVSMIVFLYFKLVRFVKQISKRVIPANTLSRAERELKMVRRTVILVSILFTVCFPYALFVFLSFFQTIPKYHFRIVFIFIDTTLLLIMIVLFQFNEPLKTSLMKIVVQRTNMVAPTVA